jgi:hypothetical protein
MKRRDFLHVGLQTGVLVSAAAALPQWATAVSLDKPLALEQAAAEAWLYGLMLIENARARSNTLANEKPNTLIHAQTLTTPKTQSVTTPNNDTLYSRAWIDLASGPVVLAMPDVGERYVSYAFMDMYGNNFAILGSRTTGGGAASVTLVGPNQAAPPASKNIGSIRSPTRWVWLLIRLLVDDDADVPKANALQQRMRLAAPAVAMPPTYAKRTDAWPDYFSAMQALIIENGAPATDTLFFKRIAALGITPQGEFSAKRFSEAQSKQINAGIEIARKQLISTQGGRIEGGWSYPKNSLGDFGQHYLYRAQIALGGLAALPPVEAMYMRPIATDGTYLLPGSKVWRLHFDKERLPPVDGFWSLTMYQPTTDGQFFFFDNPINRYAIGDRTKGLRYEADGSLDIWISRNDPGTDRQSNWLPAPPTEKFAVIFRAYLPNAEFLDGSYLLPYLKAV